MTFLQNLIDRIKIKKKYKFPLITGLIIIISGYFVIQYVFPDSYSVSSLIKYCINLYTNFIVSIVTKTLQLLDYNIFSTDLHFIIDDDTISPIYFKYFKIRWLIFFLFTIWITPVTYKKRTLFSLLAIILFIMFNFLNFFALFVITNDITLIDKYRELLFTIIAFIYILSFMLWVKSFKTELTELFVRLNVNETFLKRTYTVFIIILFITVIINNFILYFLFSFDNYKYFILISAKGILNIFGYEASLQYPLLVGIKGDVHFVKPCLGIKILVTFVAFIMLTGTNYKKQIVFSIVGLIILNLANILRIVAIFMHLQTDLDEQASVEFHDYLKYVTYSLVFILWIIWLERYSDMWPYIRKKQQ